MPSVRRFINRCFFIATVLSWSWGIGCLLLVIAFHQRVVFYLNAVLWWPVWLIMITTVWQIFYHRQALDSWLNHISQRLLATKLAPVTRWGSLVLLTFWALFGWVQSQFSLTDLRVFMHGLSAIVLMWFVTTWVVWWSQWRQSLQTLALSSPAPAPWQRWEKISVVFVIVSAIAVRLVHLTALAPYTDEYFHLLSAQQLLAGVPMSELYQRSLVIVTFPVAASFWLFHTSLGFARLPGVLFNALAILPLYAVLRRISPRLAILGTLLYTFNPWIIAISKNVREYAYYPFWYYTLIWVWVQWWLCIPAKVKFAAGQWQWLRHRHWWIYSAVLLCVPVYALIIDPLSTFKNCLIIYLAVGLALLIWRIDWSHRRTAGIVGAATLLSVVATIFIVSTLGFVSPLPRFSSYWLDLLFHQQWQQWYSPAQGVLMFGLLVLVILSLIFRQTVSLIGGSIWLWLIGVYVYSFHFDRYTRPRYGFLLELLHVLVVALLIWILAAWVARLWSPKRPRFAMVTAGLALVFWQPLTAWHAMTAVQQDQYTDITQEYHDRVVSATNFLVNQARPGDVLVGTTVVDWFQFSRPTDRTTFSDLIHFNYTNNQLEQIISTNPHGWFVVDERRLRWSGLSNTDFQVNTTTFHFIKQIDGQYLFQWR